MSRTPARIATALICLAMATPALSQNRRGAEQPAAQPQVQAQPQAQSTSASRQPADAQTRAAYDRADSLSRSIFWGEQAQINPMDPEAGAKAAAAMRELGRYAEAAEMAGQVLMVQPQNVEAMLEVGRGQIAGGQAFYGIQALEQARALRPTDWRPWSLLGTAYEQVRRYDDAAAAWAQALALSPENPDVLTNMAVASMARGQMIEAEPLLRRAAAQPNASLKVRLNLAMALGLNGKLGEAEQMLRRDLPPDQADKNLEWLRARMGGAQTAAAQTGRTWSSLQGG